MIGRIIALSVRHRPLVLLMTLVVTIIGAVALYDMRLDAIPDLSDVQVIVVTDFPGQSDEVVDDQVTIPLSSALLTVPGATDVRGLSMFGLSFVYVLFEDGTDLYWARSRVLEQLNSVHESLPAGVQPRLGPDATGVGWVYQYVLVPGFYCAKYPRGIWHDERDDQWYASADKALAARRAALVRVRAFEKPGNCPLDQSVLLRTELDLAELRRLQDWYLRFPLSAVEGVAEVAPIGGFVRQYQVVLDPPSLQAYGVSVPAVTRAIERSNTDVGASVLERSENEYMVRGRGYLRNLEDVGRIPVGVNNGNTPVRLRDVATLQIGGEARRGVGEYNGEGEAVGAVVIGRFGENAYRVIHRVKARLKELEDGLPPGVLVVPTYDRSALIERAVHTLRSALIEELAVVALICLLFLAHLRSAIVAIVSLPVGLLISTLIMQVLGINANIMSLGGLALAIGVMVDSAVVMIENAHKHLEHERERVAAGALPRVRNEIIAAAAQEVGPSLFSALLIMAVSFVPIFALGEQSGRLFKPLAFTKTFAITAAAVLGITLVPALMVTFVRGRIPSEARNPLNRLSMALYAPLFRLTLRWPWTTVAVALLIGMSAIFPLRHLGEEFMPPLNEGDLLYMPTTDPSINLTKSKELLQQTDKLIRMFPEVVSVHGKIGRADTATDPAPLSMIETTVQLQSDPRLWRQRTLSRFFSAWPSWMKWPLTTSFWPETRPITIEELKFGWSDADGTRYPGLNDALHLPGVANAWPYPIEGRINMLSTGMKTPIGLKFTGPDLEVLDQLAQRAALALRTVPGTISAYAERAFGGYHFDLDIDRERAATYGLTTGDVQDVIQTAIGGKNVTTIVNGAERYPLNVRYPRDLRSDPETIADVLVVAPNGESIPLAELTKMSIHSAPPMVRTENAQRTAWVYVDFAGRDLGGYVREAQGVIDAQVRLPAGYSRVWSGRFEALQAANARLRLVIPITLALIVVLLYVGNQSWFRVGVVLLAVPFSLVGALWLLWALGYNMSIAVWVGIIALLGVDAETGQVMLLYLDRSYERLVHEDRLHSRRDLYDAVYEGAVKRLRPKSMTIASAIIGLLPLLWATGSGAEVTRRIVAPMIGGLTVGFFMELLVYPVVFYLVKRHPLPE